MKSGFTPGNGDVEPALAHFVRVFNTLDWEVFAACFAEDATVFEKRDGRWLIVHLHASVASEAM